MSEIYFHSSVQQVLESISNSLDRIANRDDRVKQLEQALDEIIDIIRTERNKGEDYESFIIDKFNKIRRIIKQAREK